MSDEPSSHNVPPELQCVSYTNLFNIRRRVRKINDLYIPLRNGVAPEQFFAFFGTLFFLIIAWFVIIGPVLNLLTSDIGLQIYALYFLGPPILMAQKIGKPMPNAKSISGWARSKLRWRLDDRVHRRGIPIAARNDPGRQFQYLRVWEPDAEGAAYLAEYFEKPDLHRDQAWTTSPTDALAQDAVPLADWVNEKFDNHTSAEQTVRADRERERRENQTIASSPVFGTVDIPKEDAFPRS